jgi:hypothetical protein
MTRGAEPNEKTDEKQTPTASHLPRVSRAIATQEAVIFFASVDARRVFIEESLALPRQHLSLYRQALPIQAGPIGPSGQPRR